MKWYAFHRLTEQVVCHYPSLRPGLWKGRDFCLSQSFEQARAVYSLRQARIFIRQLKHSHPSFGKLVPLSEEESLIFRVLNS